MMVTEFLCSEAVAKGHGHQGHVEFALIGFRGVVQILGDSLEQCRALVIGNYQGMRMGSDRRSKRRGGARPGVGELALFQICE